MTMHGLIGPLAGLCFGLILGSFAGMASYRWPRGQSWLTPSCCPCCGQRLRPGQLVPVLSWLFQRGKAACCGAPVSGRYCLIELACGLLTALAGAAFGPGPELAILAGLICTLAILTTIDLETGFIPDGCHLAIAGLGILWLNLFPPASWYLPLLSMAQTTGIGVLLAWGYSRLRGRDMMGWGDVKLMAASGLWMAPALVPAYLLVSGLAGAAFGLFWRRATGQEEFPFGPVLAMALLLIFCWQTLLPGLDGFALIK